MNEYKVIVEQNKKFRNHKLGGFFYPKWMEKISREFEEMLIRDEFF